MRKTEKRSQKRKKNGEEGESEDQESMSVNKQLETVKHICKHQEHTKQNTQKMPAEGEGKRRKEKKEK